MSSAPDTQPRLSPEVRDLEVRDSEGRKFPRWITPLLLFLSMVLLVVRQLHKPNLMTSFTDDCYYYLVIARNLATGHGQTFGGIGFTNGFHPLWGYLLAGSAELPGALGGTSFHHFFLFISVVIVLAALATFVLVREILMAYCAPLLAEALALAISACCTHLYLLGMEVILTVPLLLALLLLLEQATHDSGRQRMFVIGLVGALAVLSRLDCVLLLGLMALLSLVLIDFRGSPGLRTKAAALALGFCPLVILYAASNQFFFHTWLPVSGMAKHLKTTYVPSPTPWHNLLILVPRYLIVLDVAALLLLPWVFRKLGRRDRALWSAVIAFPLLHLLLVSMLSDWPLDRWYAYTFVFALCPVAALLCGPVAGTLLRRFPVPVAVLAAGLWVGSFAWQLSSRYWIPSSPLTVAGATALQRFATTHPGVYAVGDRAGVIGFLIPDHIVQLEGLVMDREFLNHIMRQEDLRTVLNQYGVRYYVANPFLPIAGCMEASEPLWAGPGSPHMKSEFCGKPVLQFRNPADYRVELVYDLEGGLQGGGSN